MSYLCNLEIKPLSVMLFANIFSHSVGYFFILFVVSFAVKKIVTLSPICLFLFLFLLPWETDLRKHWYDLCQRMFCLCSLLRVFWWGDFLLAYKRASCLWDYITEICVCGQKCTCLPCCVSIYRVKLQTWSTWLIFHSYSQLLFCCAGDSVLISLGGIS